MKKALDAPWRVTAYGAHFVVETHTETATESRDEKGNLCEWSEYIEATAILVAHAPLLFAILVELSKNFVGTYGQDDRSDNEIDAHQEHWEKVATQILNRMSEMAKF